jgi:hypothetical protein
MRTLVLVSVVALLCECSPGEDAPRADPPRIGSIARNYKTLRLITPEPVEVDPELAARCAGVTQADIDAARKRHGVHAYASVSIYMNEAAARTFGKPNRDRYPEGAVIVKEKHFGHYQARDGRDAGGGEGVGGMVKRASGFDLAHGDWEYFYFTDPKKIECGRIASCVQCHAAAAGKADHVFGTWAKTRDTGK